MADYNSVEEIFAAGVSNATVLVNNTAYDDNVFTAAGASWLKFNGNTVSNVYVSGNTFFGFGVNAEHLAVNRRDTKMWYLHREEGTLFGYYRFLKFRWRGYSAYNNTSTSYSLIYDVILWDTGHISLRMVNIPTSYYNGSFQLNANSVISYTVPTNASPNVTFTPQNANNSSYKASYTTLTLDPPYDRKYLIRSAGIIYTIADGVLVTLDAGTPTAELFRTYGVDEISSSTILTTLKDPEILYWQDSTDVPRTKSVTVYGTPPTPQAVITDLISNTHPSVQGISSIIAASSDDVLYSISVDGGSTWRMFDTSNNTWCAADADSGMSKVVLNAVTAAAWAELITTKTFHIRFILPTSVSYVNKLTINYTIS